MRSERGKLLARTLDERDQPRLAIDALECRVQEFAARCLTSPSSATEAGEEGRACKKRPDGQPLFAGARC